MKLLRVGEPGSEIPVAESGGRYVDLQRVTTDIDPDFFAGGGVQLVREEFDRLPEIDVDGLRLGAPIRRPGALLCIGMNYAAHAAESGAQPPTQPILFYKSPNTIVGPDDDILVPLRSEKTDWEVELGVVIGRRARYLSSPAQALEHIAGFVLSNDVSERAFQIEQSGGQWSKGKSCETFNPLGPWIVTPDELAQPDGSALGIRSFVNGEPRQDSSTTDLIFDVPFLIHHLSQYLVLEPGDVINTGTPQGVALSGRFPYLRDGDRVEIEIDGLGSQHSGVRNATGCQV